MHKYMNLFFYNIVDNMYKFKITLISLLLCLLTMGAQAQLKPRVVILTDIGQPDLEPDDTESLVHLLCYADQLEIEGIITSTGWNCDPYPTKSAAYRDSVVEASSVKSISSAICS